MQEFEIYVFHQNTNFLFYDILNISVKYFSLLNYDFTIYNTCICHFHPNQFKSACFHFHWFNKKIILWIEPFEFKCVVYCTWGISLNESYNRSIICLNKCLNKSQLKTNFNTYVFLYDTDSPVQAFLCASDEHLVQSWSGYPVMGNCVKCSGLKTLFTL